MINPFHIIGHNILSTKLAPFPPLSTLQPTQSLPHMLIDFIDIEDQSTLSALLMVGVISALIHQVVDSLSDVDSSHALLTAD